MNPVLFDQNRAEVEAFTRRYAQKMKKSTSTKATITNIPTVVHVLHNGAAVGTYPNISDVQIMSAIANLNDAFKNEGSVYAGSTFLGASSYNSPMDIEFVFWAISVCAGNDGYDGLKLATHFRWDPHNPNANKNSTTGIGEINYVAKYIS